MYVWLARDKASEWIALSRVFARQRPVVRPLIDAVYERFSSETGSLRVEPVAYGIASRLAALSAVTPVWFDVGNLLQYLEERDVLRVIQVVQDNLGFFGERVVPVVRATIPVRISHALWRWAKSVNSGICLRIDGFDGLRQKVLSLADCVKENAGSWGEVDLIADAQDLPRTHSISQLAAEIPFIAGVRSWTVSGSSFPAAVTHLSPDAYEHTIERAEWTSYRQAWRESRDIRMPWFGDYATQCGRYNRSPRAKPSPTVRYTTRGNFVILRGRRTGDSDEDQYIGHARFLAAAEYFAEVAHTQGDSYVEYVARDVGDTGSASTWRVTSLLRHVEVTSRQVASVISETSESTRSRRY